MYGYQITHNLQTKQEINELTKEDKPDFIGRCSLFYLYVKGGTRMEKTYLISDAAKQVHVETHVLRSWEEELGLPIKRNKLGHR